MLHLSDSDTIFRCAPDNPSVDSRCVRLQVQGTPLLIVKDGKHSVGKAHASAEDIIQWYSQAMFRLRKYAMVYKVIYILLTNRIVSEDDRMKALANCSNLLIVCADNLSIYMPSPLANQGLVVNDDMPEEEEEWSNNQEITED